MRRGRLSAVLCAPIGGTERLGVAYLEGLEDGAQFSREHAELAGELARTIAPIARRLLGAAPHHEEDATADIRTRFPAPSVVGRAPAVQRMLEQAALAASSRAPVLLTGPTGAGKSALVLEIHAASRRTGRLVTVNAANLRGDLLEADLFGVRPRAATEVAARPGKLVTADGGTLFLDEVGTMEPALQSRLLTVLETGSFYPVGADLPRSVDVRWIVATNADLHAEVQAGRFRGDLLSRIAVWTLAVPPLSERLGDVPLLAAELCARVARDEQVAPLPLTPGAARHLQVHDWPDNIRGLRSAVYRGLLRAHGAGRDHIDVADLTGPIPEPSAMPGAYHDAMRSWQREWLGARLEEHDWNVGEAARAVALSRARLYALIAELGLER